MKSPAHRNLKTVATGVLTAAFLVGGAGAASAHVKVVPDSTTANGYTHVTFNVPNESATAKTSKLVVQLPTDEPFTSVSVKAVDGWKAQVITSDLPKAVIKDGTTMTKAATSVEWTADVAHQISQNEYQSFSLSLGELPSADTTVILPAVQTYTDGKVVYWDEKMVAGQVQPKHPAPSFVTTAVLSTTTETAPMTMEHSGAPVGTVWGILLGAVGALLGGIALGLVLTGRRKASPAN